MILQPARPLGQAETGGPPIAPPDPRLAAFANLIAAFDRRDWKAGRLATRELRALGLSVCPITPSGGRRGG